MVVGRPVTTYAQSSLDIFTNRGEPKVGAVEGRPSMCEKLEHKLRFSGYRSYQEHMWSSFLQHLLRIFRAFLSEAQKLSLI